MLAYLDVCVCTGFRQLKRTCGGETLTHGFVSNETPPPPSIYNENLHGTPQEINELKAFRVCKHFTLFTLNFFRLMLRQSVIARHFLPSVVKEFEAHKGGELVVKPARGENINCGKHFQCF